MTVDLQAISSTLIAGLGGPGLNVTEAELRAGNQIIACDPKSVTERTLERIFTPADVDLPKAVGAQRVADELAMGSFRGHVGRLEDVVGASTIRSDIRAVYLAVDRPSAIRRATDILLRVVTEPTRVISLNVGQGVAQVRSFIFPLEDGPCPFCNVSNAYLDMSFRDDSFSCELPGLEGDIYTVPFSPAEAHVAAGLALTAHDWEPGTEVTLSLNPPALIESRLAKDPDCPLKCGEMKPWPEATVRVDHGTPFRHIVAQTGVRPAAAAITFLRPVSLGVVCGCGSRRKIEMLRQECPRCGQPMVPLQGAAYEFSLTELVRFDPQASPASIGLPAPELILVSGTDVEPVSVETVP